LTFDEIQIICRYSRYTVTEAPIELLRGTLDMLVLKLVALGPSHGYAIAQRLQQISKDFFQVHQGSLYPALHRLEDRGWLQAEWQESETGREAKFYALTKKGRKQLNEGVLNGGKLSEAVALVLRTAEWEAHGCAG
jgi:PadR family transcriptional regulator, regulatory protein PadR